MLINFSVTSYKNFNFNNMVKVLILSNFTNMYFFKFRYWNTH